MASTGLSQLLKLSAGEHAELAMLLWKSLSEAERDEELELTAEQYAELDRRWAEHLENPGSAVPWFEVRRKLLAGSNATRRSTPGPSSTRDGVSDEPQRR